MEMVIIKDRTKLQEVIWGLPSKRVMHTPDVILIKHPVKEEMIVLKSRHRDENTRNLDISTFEYFNDRLRGWEGEYDDLYKKNIIIDNHMLSDRGKAALLNL